MAGSLRKTMEYLGWSGTESEYGEYEDVEPMEEDQMSAPERVVTPLHQVDVELSRIVTVHPTTYNEAREIGEAFRDGIPVIMNLTGMSEAEAKRMVDFSAGLVFGLHGVIERVTNRVFLLSPSHVAVNGERNEVAARFFNQG